MNKYNLSEIFKNAWTTFRNVQASQIRKIKPYCSDEAKLMELVRDNMKPFSYYLKESWEKAKSEARYKAYQVERKLFEAVKASELKAGDVVDVEYGIGPGFTEKREIASISDAAATPHGKSRSGTRKASSISPGRKNQTSLSQTASCAG